MPFASEAQRRKFYAMAERGEISKNKINEYQKETKKDIPERVTRKKPDSETVERTKEKTLKRAKEARARKASAGRSDGPDPGLEAMIARLEARLNSLRANRKTSDNQKQSGLASKIARIKSRISALRSRQSQK